MRSYETLNKLEMEDNLYYANKWGTFGFASVGLLSFGAEFYQAGFEGEDSVIFTQAYVLAWQVTGASLADNDGSRFGHLAVHELNSHIFGLRVTNVFCRATCFLMCHKLRNVMTIIYEHPAKAEGGAS